MKQLYFNDIFPLLNEFNQEIAQNLDIYYRNQHLSLKTLFLLKCIPNYIKTNIYFKIYNPSQKELSSICKKLKINNTKIGIYWYLILNPNIQNKFVDIIINEKSNYIIKL